MERIHIHLSPELIARLKRYCDKTGVLRAEFIRRAVEAALRRAESKQ